MSEGITLKGEWCGMCLRCGHEYWEADIRPLCGEHNPALNGDDVSLHERKDGCICEAIRKHDAICK